MYRQCEMHFPRAIEVWQYHDVKYGGPGRKRERRSKASRDIRNQRQKERKCRWRLRQHFEAGDVYVTLTCRKDARPEDMAGMKRMWSAFAAALRKEYKKSGQEFKWIRNIEVGKRNAWHIHAALKTIPGRNMLHLITAAWPHGRVDVQEMYDEGRFQTLATYLTKTPKTDPGLREASHDSSRNLPVPEPKEKTFTRWDTFEGQEIKQVPAGWYVDKDSIEEFTTPCGFPVRRFQMFPLDPGELAKEKREHPNRRYMPERPAKVRLVPAGVVPYPEQGEEIVTQRESENVENRSMDSRSGTRDDEDG